VKSKVKVIEANLLMRKSESLTLTLKLANMNGSAACAPVLLVLCLLLALPSAAPAQTPNFTLSIQGFNPPAIIPGGDTTAQITVGAQNGFTGTVSLSCVVTSQEAVPNDFCAVSPTSVVVPGGAFAVINAPTTTSAGFYSVYIVGTTPSIPTPQQTLAQDVTVLSVTPSFTITIQTPVAPSSVSAGNGAQGVININPINGYVSPAGGVTLSCASITPLVTLPPICSFNPPSPTVSSGTVATSTLTITTFGPITTGNVPHLRPVYAFWLPLPALALIGLGVGGKKSRKAWTLLSLFILSAAFLLIPACTNTSTTTTTPNGITPANTYTFTIAGVDANHNVSSNSGTGTTSPSVTLGVTAPTN
jgi:hypothetical protein